MCPFPRASGLLGAHCLCQRRRHRPQKDPKGGWVARTRSVSEVRGFIGLASYYRRFVKDFASVAKPLHELTKKYARFNWTDECQEAFEQLKSRLTSAPVLGYPLDSGQLLLDTDASDWGIGAVLSQVQEGEERVLAYGSRRLSATEQNYCTTRRELLAAVEFTSHFRQYLLGRSFIIRTDHSSLRWLTRMREPEGQLARWLEKLAEYDFRVIHRPGDITKMQTLSPEDPVEYPAHALCQSLAFRTSFSTKGFSATWQRVRMLGKLLQSNLQWG
ncbi:hypothetical protein DPEC_G00061060 [Dallia pectoralis]|uniref:Uncharacterized protein n=1 Tax=Dallia pectoralis TaxID=75939 RepID=A0ACC2H6V1_DALPE|nr:hypothetical protein DPEC_G00061060 [Dallia pectoralis]